MFVAAYLALHAQLLHGLLAQACVLFPPSAAIGRYALKHFRLVRVGVLSTAVGTGTRRGEQSTDGVASGM